jgi:hypothetical protein
MKYFQNVARKLLWSKGEENEKLSILHNEGLYEGYLLLIVQWNEYMNGSTYIINREDTEIAPTFIEFYF